MWLLGEPTLDPEALAIGPPKAALVPLSQGNQGAEDRQVTAQKHQGNRAQKLPKVASE